MTKHTRKGKDKPMTKHTGKAVILSRPKSGRSLNRLYFFVTAAVILGIALGVVLMTRGSGSQQEGSQDAAPRPTITRLAKEPNEVDSGTVASGTLIRTSFAPKNTGSAPPSIGREVTSDSWSHQEGSQDAASGPTMARLAVEPSEVDFGTLASGKGVRTSFTLKNVGNAPLSISKAITRVVEGCCPTDPVLSSKYIEPGEKANLFLDLVMHDGMLGPHRFEILVYSNDVMSPVTTMKLKGTWK